MGTRATGTIATDLRDLPDPTDWLPTSLPLLSALESSLRCQICKDFFDAPVITACRHTFCSLCIRRVLHADGKCPTCRTIETDSGLRRNVQIGEIVEAFVGARDQILGVARSGGGGRAGFRGEENGEGTGGGRVGGKGAGADVTPASSGSLAKKKREMIIVDSEDEGDEAGDGEYAEEPEPEPDDGLAACPVCGKRMIEYQVFNHLDDCTGEAQPSRPLPSSSRPTRSVSNSKRRTRPSSQASPSKSSSTRALRSAAAAHTLPVDATLSDPALAQPLGKLTYAILSEAALRQKLSKMGIPSQGRKLDLEKRHTMWVSIWNANVDAKRRKSKRELLTDLKNWESAQGKPMNNMTKAPGWSDEGWVERHKGQFDDLVERARRAAKRRKIDSEEAEKKEEEEGEEGEEAGSSDAQRGYTPTPFPGGQAQQQQQHQQQQQVDSVGDEYPAGEKRKFSSVESPAQERLA